MNTMLLHILQEATTLWKKSPVTLNSWNGMQLFQILIQKKACSLSLKVMYLRMENNIKEKELWEAMALV